MELAVSLRACWRMFQLLPAAWGRAHCPAASSPHAFAAPGCGSPAERIGPLSVELCLRLVSW